MLPNILGIVAVVAFVWYLWRLTMPRKPSDAVRATKDRLVSKAGTKAKPGKPSEDAPPVAQPAIPAAPQGKGRCCSVCGNMATGPVCTVDGARE